MVVDLAIADKSVFVVIFDMVEGLISFLADVDDGESMESDHS